MLTIIILLAILACGVCWAFGGANGTSLGWRRVGVPITILLMGMAFLIPDWIAVSWWGLSCLLLFVATTLPYGTPSGGDSGGEIGKFFYHMTNGNELWTNILTRGLCSLAYFGSMAIFPIVYGKWLMGVIVILMGMTSVIYLTCFMGNKPPLNIMGIKLNYEEFMVGLSVGIGGLLCLL